MTDEWHGGAMRPRPMAFGGLLRGHRRAAGLTQEALAERAGLSVRGLQHLEAGDVRPARATLGALLEAFEALGLPREDCARLEATACRPARPPVPEWVPVPLPAPLTSFVGRERELVALRRLLRTERLLTLTGTGGCGKTRLALRLVAEVAGGYPAGSCVVELAAVRDPPLVTPAVAAACGVRDEPGRPLLATVTDVLRSKRFLLVLDNCEHLLDACARLAHTLLLACPGLTVLATSREPLGVAGETPWRVPSLTVPSPGSPPPRVEALQEYEAVRLFVARAVAVQPTFAITARNGPAVTAVCRRLDGLPLALELAAARLRALTVEQLLDRLEDRFRLLTDGSRTALPRQQTLRATVEWSAALLDEPQRRLFARLAVFADGWALEAAEALGEDVPGADEVLELLTRLVDKSLVVAEAPPDGPARYHLLETLRQYALESLEVSAGTVAARARHAAYYVALAERAAPELVAASQVGWLDRLEVEHANIRAALHWLTERGEAEPGLRLATALLWWWMARGHRHEGAECLAALLALPGPAAPATRMRALDAAGFLAWVQGYRGPARAYHEESLSIARRIGDRRGMAYALHGLGRVADRGSDRYAPVDAGRLAVPGEAALARTYHHESLAIQREVGDRHGASWSHYFLGAAAMTQQDHAAADAQYRESLAEFRAMGDRFGTANALRCLGEIARRRGDLATARALQEESLATAQALGNREGVTRALDALGAVATDQRDFATARGYFAASLAHGRDLGPREGVAASLERFAGLAATQGQLERALRLAGAAAALREAIGATAPPAWQPNLELGMPFAEQLLSEAAQARAWSEGRALPAEEAVAYALQQPSVPP